LHHPCCQAVSEDVRADATARQKVRPLQGFPSDLAHDSWQGQRPTRRGLPQEYTARGAGTAHVAQVEGQGLSHVTRERQPVLEPALASHQDVPNAPANVIDLERQDLACAQAEARQQKQDRESAAAACCEAIGRRSRDHPLDFLGREKRGDGGQSPATNGLHGCRKIRGCAAVQETEAQERTQHRREQPYERDRASEALLKLVAPDRQRVEVLRTFRQLLRHDELTCEPRVQGDRVGAETLLVA